MIRRALIAKRVGQLLTDAKIDAPPVDVEKLAKRTGLQVLFHPFDSAPEDISGCIIQEDGIVAIGVNSRHGRNRQRFTIAHELGHFVLHRSTLETVHLTRSFRSSVGEDTNEIEANAFAADLLMPESMLRAILGDEHLDIEDASTMIDELAQKFEVSTQAMTIRLVRMGILQHT